MARKQKTIHYLYKTTCLVTGRYYVGMHSTSKLEDGYMGSGKRLRYSIRKYGIDNHKKEILEFFESRDLLIEAEKKAITEDMITDRNCMNLKLGGTGGFVNEEHRKKAQSAASKAFKEKILNDEEFKKSFSEIKKENTKKRILQGTIKFWKENYDWSGKNHSEETRQLISKKMKDKGIGETNSQYGTCWITRNGENKKVKKEDLEIFITDGWIKGRT